MEELRNRATKFMQIEEHINYHRNHPVEGPNKVKEKDKDRSNRPMLGQNDRFRENRGPRFSSYTHLVVLKGRILDEALQAELIPVLKQSQALRNADTSKTLPISP